MKLKNVRTNTANPWCLLELLPRLAQLFHLGPKNNGTQFPAWVAATSNSAVTTRNESGWEVAWSPTQVHFSWDQKNYEWENLLFLVP